MPTSSVVLVAVFLGAAVQSCTRADATKEADLLLLRIEPLFVNAK